MLDDGALGVVAILHQKNEDVLHFVAGDLCLPQMTFVAQPAIPEIGKGHSQLLSTQNQVIKDLLRYFHWKAVGIFYHTHIGEETAFLCISYFFKDVKINSYKLYQFYL